MHLINRSCQYKAYKDDKSNFVFKRMLFAKFTQAYAAFGRRIISSDGYFHFSDDKLNMINRTLNYNLKHFGAVRLLLFLL